jgi:gluconate 2-dehydrogenase gamma chain
MKGNEFDRRDFLKITAAGLGGAVLLPGCSQPASPWLFFTEAEASVIEAITEQIIPGDDDAGAKDAHVINFIDRQLAGFYAKHQETYRKGITGVQQTSEIMYRSKFESLDWRQQMELLQALEAGRAEGEIWQTESAPAFFGLIRDHTMQGFYGSPRHGGNRHFASFQMLGLDYPRIIGQNRYDRFPGGGR